MRRTFHYQDYCDYFFCVIARPIGRSNLLSIKRLLRRFCLSGIQFAPRNDINRVNFNYIKLLTLIFIFFIGFIVSVFAQDISVSAEIDSNKIPLGSSAQLTVTLNGTQDAQPPEMPTLDGLDIRLLGPSQRVSIVNGQYSSSLSFSYSLFPTKVGTYKIPALDVDVQGTKYTTEPIDVEVVAFDASGSGLSPDTSSAPALSLEDKLFLVLKIPKTESYLNEKIPVKIMLFVSGIAVRDIQFPALSALGFTLDPFEQPKQYSEVIKGMRFDIVEFNAAITPTHLGELKIGPAKLDCNVVVRSSGQSPLGGRRDGFFDDDFFGEFFNRQEKRSITLQSKESTVIVLDLPSEGKPENFSGATGHFEFQASVTPPEVNVGDPLTLRMQIKTDANPQTVQFPDLAKLNLSDFKLYDPTIKDNKGLKTYEQVLIPKSDKITEIPAIEFSYFDPDLKKYRTIAQGPFAVKVNAFPEGEAPKIFTPQESRASVQPETIGKDIVFIKEDIGNMRFINERIYQRPWVYIVIFIYLAVWILLFIYFQKTHRLATDSVYARRMAAPQFARQGLNKTKHFLQAQKTKEFYDELFKTLQQYLTHKFHLSSGVITSHEITAALGQNIKDQHTVLAIKNILQECEMARYASVSLSQEQMQKSYDELERVIDYLERNIK